MTDSLAERERLLDALQDRLAASAGSGGIPRRPADQPALASFVQRRLWFLDRLDPGNAAYNVPVAVRLRGVLDVDALDRAIQTVVQRHEALRTTFEDVDGEPVQVIATESQVRLERADAGDDVAGWIARESFRPFDLRTGPLMRCGLVSEGPDRHVLLVVAHHTVVDGWSFGVLFHELDECYRSFTAGASPALVPLPVQYADFAVWQREQPAGDLDYWRTRLDGAPPVLELPGETSSPADGTFAGSSASLDMTLELAVRVRELAGSADATVFMVLLAAFAGLLGRLAGTDDLVLGAPIATRPHPQVESLVGCFLNTVALRTDLSGDPSFRELLTRVRESTVDAYQRQVPFEQLVEAIQPERGTTHTPVFQVMVNHTSTVPLPDRFGGMAMDSLELRDPPSKFPLTLYIREDGGRLGLDALFQAARFSRERVAGMLDQVVLLLEQVTADPDRPVTSCSLVARGTPLPDLSAALTRDPQPTVPAMIEKHVRTTPDSVAVESGDVRWTYADLWRQATAVKESLAAQRLTRGAVVAVSGGRTPALVAGMLGVLLAEGVLLTLDPGLPRLRRRAMLTESAATHVLDTDTGSIERTEAQPGETNPEAAYLFFTSGTTGVPKAVLGRHAGLAHFLRWQRDTFDVGPADRCAQLTGLSFDVVLRDVFLPLVSGATLCVPAAGGDLSQVFGWLAEQRVTITHTVPTLAEAWLAEAGQHNPRLRVTFFAGEPLTADLVRAWRSATGDGTVVNLYGPTETTLAKLAYVVPADCAPGVQPVGTPMPGAQALVVTSTGNPAGVGEVGEIVIRTPYRSLGYANAPDSWPVNPGTGDQDDRLYHTGDLGRLRPDDRIAILGRADRQVKIRGVRIETDEVAAIATRHPTVTQAAVTTAPDTQGHPMLVAYLVAPTRTAATETQLRSYIGKRLPQVMVPAAMVFVDRIPFTANGKVDWRALPPVEVASIREEEFVAPRTDIERGVAEIIGTLLRRDRVGVNDSFFTLGGQSLMAMQLVSRLTKAFGVTLPLRVIFENPTVGGIAEAVTDAGGRS
ncbi:non-ribosomal peptide synthetase [Actinocrispum wychmicini]|uniref:Amino acid adenylation domain-containing protein n=1 Tax=Actinocrispum wychmicini TaxID=1213861 RepID=A0A4R2JB73_9PSEU|nr:condensation domain-containing protein [Actinocrispum wychmicini]TCO55607.1 amino acid adenylation domain-containing protein [Actinocrispum wychmicini]